MEHYIVCETTDISGNTSFVTGLEKDDFEIVFVIDEEDQSAQLTVTEPVSGVYQFETSLTGEGILYVRRDDVDIYPDAQRLEGYSKSTDDVYSQVISNIASPVTSDPTSRYGVFTLQIKEGDDFIEVLNVLSRHKPLTGYSDWSFKLYPEAALNSSEVTEITGSSLVTVVSESEGTLELSFDGSMTENQIEEGSSTVTLYGDVQAIKDGKIRTLLEGTFVVKRDFNRPNGS